MRFILHERLQLNWLAMARTLHVYVRTLACMNELNFDRCVCGVCAVDALCRAMRAARAFRPPSAAGWRGPPPAQRKGGARRHLARDSTGWYGMVRFRIRNGEADSHGAEAEKTETKYVRKKI